MSLRQRGLKKRNSVDVRLQYRWRQKERALRRQNKKARAGNKYDAPFVSTGSSTTQESLYRHKRRPIAQRKRNVTIYDFTVQ